MSAGVPGFATPRRFIGTCRQPRPVGKTFGNLKVRDTQSGASSIGVEPPMWWAVWELGNYFEMVSILPIAFPYGGKSGIMRVAG